MQTHFTPPSSQPANTMGSIALLKLLIARHPYTASLFFFVYWIALLLSIGRILSPIYFATHMPLLLYNTLGETLMALIVALPIALLGWWSETGFTRGVNGRGILLCLLPIIFTVGPTLLNLQRINEAPALILVTGITLSLLVGFAEEGMFRGVLLRCLLPKGIWPAVLFSALLFTSIHLTNLLGGASWGYVTDQLISAFGGGILLAALRFRTGSIWPCVLLHAGRDVIGLIYQGMYPATVQSVPPIAAHIVNIVFCLIYLSIALVLLRPGQVRKLEIAYGLVKQPAAVLPGNLGPLDSPKHPSYPADKDQPSPASVSNNQPAPSPGSMSYREYTFPETYRDNPPPQVPQ